MSTTFWRRTAIVSFGGFLLMSCIAAVQASGASSSRSPVSGVPGHWINSGIADDPVEQFVVRKTPPATVQPAEPTAVETAEQPDAEQPVAHRPATRATVTWGSVLPTSAIWVGVGACGVCLIGLIGWQWARSRRRLDVPEVAILSLAAFQASSKSVPRSAQPMAQRKAA